MPYEWALPRVKWGCLAYCRALCWPHGEANCCRRRLYLRSARYWASEMLGVIIVGQLGLGDTATRGDEPGEMGDALPAVQLGLGRTAIAIAAGYSSTCALLDNGLIKCWGCNNFGQLGLRDTSMRGSAPNQMGDLLASVELGDGREAG